MNMIKYGAFALFLAGAISGNTQAANANDEAAPSTAPILTKTSACSILHVTAEADPSTIRKAVKKMRRLCKLDPFDPATECAKPVGNQIYNTGYYMWHHEEQTKKQQFLITAAYERLTKYAHVPEPVAEQDQQAPNNGQQEEKED